MTKAVSNLIKLITDKGYLITIAASLDTKIAPVALAR